MIRGAEDLKERLGRAAYLWSGSREPTRAGAVAEDERGDHQIAGGDGRDVAADVFDDADELVADRADGVVGLAPVVPEVRPAHAASTTRTTASVGSLMIGSGRSPTSIEPGR